MESLSRPELNVAIWQAPGLSGAPDAMLDRLAALLAGGTLEGADLLLLPELWSCGYFDETAVRAGAEPIDGPTAQRLSALARAHGLAIAWGHAEREAPDQPIWNAATLIGADGAVLLHYRKVNLWDRYEKALFAPGTEPSALATLSGWKLGFSICYDTEFPETFRDLAVRGADLVLAPTALGAEFGVVGDALLRTRAFENGLFLAFANRSGCEHGYAFGAGSGIVGPDGTFLAKAEVDSVVVRASLSHDRIAAARRRSPYLTDLRWAAPRMA
ncbi:nitrilase-related carbon-nitrogen hydrolase [Novosphingobium sp.]|uniref:nitrilase-related carbon-nitrogen hydrolase n=1 Tax=Novosphingobium sp. TaxID=1874826 RepID=UPI0038BB6D33